MGELSGCSSPPSPPHIDVNRAYGSLAETVSWAAISKIQRNRGTDYEHGKRKEQAQLLAGEEVADLLILKQLIFLAKLSNFRADSPFRAGQSPDLTAQLLLNLPAGLQVRLQLLNILFQPRIKEQRCFFLKRE